MSAPFVPVADLAQVPPGRPFTVTIDDREIALFNIDGTVYAIDNICPHQGGPLSEGYVEGTTVTCPWHAWCFRLENGQMTLGAFATVDVFDVSVEGSKISVNPTPRAG